MAMTSEFRHGTIRPTFVFTPARTRVVDREGRWPASASASASVALGSALSLGVGVAMIRARGYDVLIDSGDVRRLLLGTMLMSALWAAPASGSAALVRNQVAGIVGLFAWVFVVEILLFQYLPGVGRYAPGGCRNGDDGRHSRRHVDAPALRARRRRLLAGYAIVLVAAGALGHQSPRRHLGPRGHQLSIRSQRTSSHIQDRTDAGRFGISTKPAHGPVRPRCCGDPEGDA